MSCTNCFSGCVETTSDKCVKYTGNPIEFLGIETGDSLESVEKAITDYLSTVLTGEGISPVIDPTYICDIVKNYFPQGDPTLVDILTAIIKAVCYIEAEIVVERGRIDTIEADYTVGCINVGVSAGTHAVLEAVIASLCIAKTDITTIYSLFNLYVKISDINTYIQNYINQSGSNNMYTKMVPYVIYPFYPSASIMSNFGITGEGIGTWQKIYLCNGYNGLTPDLRGRSLIGTTNMGGGAFDPNVDPSLGNPTYSLGDTNGQNSIVLLAAQIAAHTHDATAVVSDPGHHTTIKFAVSTDTWAPGGINIPPIEIPSLAAKPVLDIDNSGIPLEGDHTDYTATTSTNDLTGITVGVTNAENVGGGAHDNVHPVHACHYIMYIP